MLKQGHIIHYPYLWKWQADRGETEGRKNRPVCVALPLLKEGQVHLVLLPLTTQPPKAEQTCLAVPEMEIRRAGLDDRKPCWVVLNECNYDIAGRSFYLDPTQAPAGRFSEAFTNQIKAVLRKHLMTGQLRQVPRR